MQRHDDREVYLLIEGDAWAYAKAADPNLGEYVRHFAQKVNDTARRWTARTTDEEPQASSPPDAITKIRELAKLREEGILTEDEFSSQKAILLERLHENS